MLILSDDFGYGSAGCYGADPQLVRTPNLDRLAKEGRRFTDANTTSSVCSPTRYSLLTGRYCWRTSLTWGVLGVYSPLHIEPSRFTMATLTKSQGYATAAIGKWHLGYGTATDSPKWRVDYAGELAPGPLEIGFDYHFAVPANHGDLVGAYVENHYVYGLRSGNIPPGTKIAGPSPDAAGDYQATYEPKDTESGRATILDLDAPRRKNERVMHVLTEKAAGWIESRPKDAPFFLYFAPVAVHNPVTPDADLAGRSRAGLYGDWIHELDRSVGRILDALDRSGRADDTLVIFSSDNGGVYKPESGRDTPQNRAIAAGFKPNGALRGGKHDVWEGGFKVPLLARWPGHVPADSVCTEMVSLADVLATTAELLGRPLPPAAEGAEDSRSFLAALLGRQAQPAREDMIVHSSDGVFAIRRGPWKYVEGVPAAEVGAASRKRKPAEFQPQLFNTHDDPQEATDVAARHPEIAAELQALLARYRDGGYSRELPPPGVKPAAAKVAALAPLETEVLVKNLLAADAADKLQKTGEKWTVVGEEYWATQPPRAEQPAGLRIAAPQDDFTVQYELNFRGAGRHSLRIDCGEAGSFRCEVSRTHCGITKNPPRGADKSAIEPLVRKPLKLAADQWYPVRLTIRGAKATLQVGDTIVAAEHALVGERKRALNLLMFGEELGIRSVVLAK